MRLLRPSSRRAFLRLGAGLLPFTCGAAGGTNDLSAPPRPLGAGRRKYGERSPWETSGRLFRPSVTPGTGSSRTPLQSQFGIITPSALHFERHHAGVPAIDPAQHELLVHGMVERPLRFKLPELLRLPAVSRIHFIECAGNSAGEQAGRPGTSPQESHGLVSCSEWTGVSLSTLLREAGIRSGGKWILAEGADACRLARSIPLAKALDDTLVAYGQNGEALRPEQGYPLRLVVPGWEGNVNIKWLSRLHVIDRAAMTKDEAVSYTDLMSNGRARHFTFEMDVKSVITRPCGGERLATPGFYEIRGIAWSGRGRVTHVEVSTTPAIRWRPARLGEPALRKAFTTFSFPWIWDGRETYLQSRAWDETGSCQPTRAEIIDVRGLHPGPDGFNHYNGIKAWRVEVDGTVSHA